MQGFDTQASMSCLSLSYFVADSQSVSQFVLALSLSGVHDQILAVDRQLQDGVMGHLPWQNDWSVL